MDLFKAYQLKLSLKAHEARQDEVKFSTLCSVIEIIKNHPEAAREIYTNGYYLGLEVGAHHGYSTRQRMTIGTYSSL